METAVDLNPCPETLKGPLDEIEAMQAQGQPWTPGRTDRRVFATVADGGLHWQTGQGRSMCSWHGHSPRGSLTWQRCGADSLLCSISFV